MVILGMWWCVGICWNSEKMIVLNAKILRDEPVKQSIVTEVVVGAINTGTAANPAGATAPYSTGAFTAVPPDPPGSATAAAAAQTDLCRCSHCCNCSRHPQPIRCCNTFCTRGQDPGTEMRVKLSQIVLGLREQCTHIKNVSCVYRRWAGSPWHKP